MPTKARYLKQFWISWATPHTDINPAEARGLSRGEAVIAINKKVQAFNPLTDLISSRLRKAKRHLTPEVTHAYANISAHESIGLAFYPRGKGEPFGLYQQYWMNPLDLLDLPGDGLDLSELGIRIAENFAQSACLSTYAVGDFPLDVFETAIADFRANRLNMTHGPVTRSLTDRIKAAFSARAMPSETQIWVAFKIGRKELYARQVGALRAGLGATALNVVDVSLGSNALEIHGLHLDKPRPVHISLTDLPADFRDLLQGSEGNG